MKKYKAEIYFKNGNYMEYEFEMSKERFDEMVYSLKEMISAGNEFHFSFSNDLILRGSELVVVKFSEVE